MLFLIQEIQINCGCLEEAGSDKECSPEKIKNILVRELIVSPHKENSGLLLLNYREHLQKFFSLNTLNTWCLTEQTNVPRSDTTNNKIDHTVC